VPDKISLAICHIKSLDVGAVAPYRNLSLDYSASSI
jgi:hypothetical protein